MKNNFKTWGYIRIFFAVLTITAIMIQLNTHLSEGYEVVNFFSYFTNLSNIFASFVLLVGGYQMLRGFAVSEGFEFIRAASVVMMLLVGLVFNTLLLNVDLGSLAPWINNIVHRLMPLLVLIDWYLYPSTYTIKSRSIWLWLIPPAVYLAYSVIRGSLVGWYAYPFFNPEKVGGATGVTLYCVGMLMGLVGIAYFVMWLSNRRRKN